MSSSRNHVSTTIRRSFLALGALSLALLLVPQIVTPCGGAVGLTPSSHHCGATFQAVSLIAVVLLLLSVAVSFVRARGFRALFLTLINAGALASIILPQSWALGICRRSDMSCHSTQAWALLVELALLALGLVTLIRVLRSPEKTSAACTAADSWEPNQAPELVAAGAPVAKSPKKRCKCCG